MVSFFCFILSFIRPDIQQSEENVRDGTPVGGSGSAVNIFPVTDFDDEYG